MAILSQTGKPGGAETIMGPSFKEDDGIVQTTNNRNIGNENYSSKVTDLLLVRAQSPEQIKNRKERG